MNICSLINELQPLAELVAPSQVATLKHIRSSLKESGMKIAVLGDFKAGKSTLINALFLKHALLPTDYSECTALPALISNGKAGMQLWMRDADGTAHEVRRTDSVDAATLAKALTAGSEEERAALAEQYSHVSLQQPNILPEGVTLIDTPGLDTPNSALMVSTMWAAHEADAIIYVVRGKMLSARETDLIAELSGSKSPKLPFFVVLTGDGHQAPAMLQNICGQIEAALLQRKIKVQTGILRLDAARASLSEKEPFVLTSEVMSDPPPMILPSLLHDGKELVKRLSERFSSDKEEAELDELRTRLLSFFGASVLPGREARLTRNLLPIMNAVQNAAALRLGILEDSAAEAEQHREARRSMEQEYNRTIESLLSDVAATQLAFLQRISEALRRVQEKLTESIDAKERAGDILMEIKSWEVTIPHEVQMEMNAEILTLEKDLRELRTRYHLMLERRMVVDSDVVTTYEAGFLSSVPTWLITVADYALFDLVSPLPFFADMVIRYVVGRLGFERFMPAAMVASLARRMAKSKLQDAIQLVGQQLEQSIKSKFNAMNAALKEGLVQKSPFAETGTVAGEDDQTNANQPDVNELNQIINRINAWKAELS